MFEQDRFVVRLQQRVQGEPAIRTCFLAGSYGRRVEDGYSDLDVAFVFRDGPARDAAYADRRLFVRSILPYVPARSFDADHVRPHFHIVLYSNGTKADFRYEAADSLAPNPWDRDLRLLKDADGWGERFQAACARVPPSRPTITAAELERLDERFWIMLWDAARQLMRGDVEKPFAIYLQLFTLTIERLLPLLPAAEPARAPLMRLQYDADPAATLRGLNELLGAYLAARERVANRYQLLLTTDPAFEREIRRLLDRTGR